MSESMSYFFKPSYEPRKSIKEPNPYQTQWRSSPFSLCFGRVERYPQSAPSLEDLPGILRCVMSCMSIQNTVLRPLLPQDRYILRNRTQYQYLHTTTAYPNRSSFRLHFHATVCLEQLNRHYTCMTITFKLSAWNAYKRWYWGTTENLTWLVPTSGRSLPETHCSVLGGKLCSHLDENWTLVCVLMCGVLLCLSVIVSISNALIRFV